MRMKWRFPERLLTPAGRTVKDFMGEADPTTGLMVVEQQGEGDRFEPCKEFIIHTSGLIMEALEEPALPELPPLEGAGVQEAVAQTKRGRPPKAAA